MELRISSHQGYQLIHFFAPAVLDSDVEQLYTAIEELLGNGHRRFAISFGANTYPYSKLMAALVRCNNLVQHYEAKLVVIQPNEKFHEALAQTRLDKVLTIVRSDKDLPPADS